MDHDKNYYYDICKRYLVVVGQWPYQTFKERLFWWIILLIMYISAYVTQMLKFVVCSNMECIYETLTPHMFTIMIMVKICTFQFNSRKIKDLTDRLFADWNMLQTKEEHNIMKRYAENGRWYALMYGPYVYVSTFLFTSMSLVPRILDVVFPLNTSRPIMLPYPAYYFVDDDQYFYYIYLHIFRFEHVSYIRNNMDNDLIYYSDKDLIYCSNGKYYKNVASSIHAHQQILQFAKLLEDTFMIAFAVQLLIITIALSVALLQLSAQLHDLPEATRYVVMIIGQLLHLFCLSFQGQQLINHSLETCDKIFHSSWFNIPVKEQKLLLFAMKKSIEPNVVTAGKIYVFSLQSFTMVVQSSMSYFTLLSSLNES
ncbi:uncharacterized protein LOC105197931 isoform X2 [Solenopsis invicta]|uniref:uncharacterized protein LOC105197931 isoform X2 n=1 Tax=Solenopsis invicta TaxID=13686 RepID=UPI00193D1277|nr:uncharacterized protein LOC105197931 isoform X2 [Solenopsis invicta]